MILYPVALLEANQKPHYEINMGLKHFAYTEYIEHSFR